MNVANSVTYLSQDFKLQGSKVRNGGADFNGQGVVWCAVLVEGAGNLIEVATDFSVFGGQPANGGVLETANETVGEYGIRNPLGGVASWSEVYMNASLESFLKGYNDPRLKSYFNPAQDGRDKDGNINREVAGVKQLSSIEDEYKGVRQGTGVADNRYSTHSQTTITTASKIIVMSAAEVWFLRAEAALRYNTGDDVENCYKQGVTVSFAQWDANGVSDYLESDNIPAAYVDVFDAKFNADAPSTITPKWDNTADKEEKLERIITQKWLALYPEGCEAWAEQRRTGYPRLIKVAVNNSGNTIRYAPYRL